MTFLQNNFVLFGKKLCINLLNFVYPPFCLHCEAPLENQTNIICPLCMSLMQIINPIGRCISCFAYGPSNVNKICSSCAREPPLWDKAAAALDYEGPAVTLITAMKYGNQPHLAKGAGAFMASQLVQLGWHFPDLIVPVPIPVTRWVQRGYNQCDHLAKNLGGLIDRPVCKILKRRSGDQHQAGLSLKQRKEETSISFYLANKKVL